MSTTLNVPKGLSRTARLAIRRFGVDTCLSATRLNDAGWAASSLSAGAAGDLGLHTVRQAVMAINAGREILETRKGLWRLKDVSDTLSGLDLWNELAVIIREAVKQGLPGVALPALRTMDRDCIGEPRRVSWKDAVEYVRQAEAELAEAT